MAFRTIFSPLFRNNLEPPVTAIAKIARVSTARSKIQSRDRFSAIGDRTKPLNNVMTLAETIEIH